MKKCLAILTVILFIQPTLATQAMHFGALGSCTCKAFKKDLRLWYATGMSWIKTYLSKYDCDTDVTSCNSWCDKYRFEPPEVKVIGKLDCTEDFGRIEKLLYMFRIESIELGQRIIIERGRKPRVEQVTLLNQHGYQVLAVVGTMLLVIATRGTAAPYLRYVPIY